jgi:hypothetical protein
MLLKVYWIVLTVDQHPLKPTEEDDDESHEWLQYQNLIGVRPKLSCNQPPSYQVYRYLTTRLGSPRIW